MFPAGQTTSAAVECLILPLSLSGPDDIILYASYWLHLLSRFPERASLLSWRRRRRRLHDIEDDQLFDLHEYLHYQLYVLIHFHQADIYFRTPWF